MGDQLMRAAGRQAGQAQQPRAVGRGDHARGGPGDGHGHGLPRPGGPPHRDRLAALQHGMVVEEWGEAHAGTFRERA